MFIFYTVTFILLTFFSFFLSLIFPSFSAIFTLLREGYLLFLIFYCLYDFTIIKKCHITIPSYTKLLFFSIILAIPYLFKGGNLALAINTFILYFSGPFLFICISSLNFSKKTRSRFIFYITLIFTLLCFVNIIFYFIQDYFVKYIPSGNITHLSRNGSFRYLGAALHPTITGFYFIYFIGLLIIIKKEKMLSTLSTIFFLFSGTRSAMIGVPVYFFLRFKKWLKFVCVFLGIVGTIIVIHLLLSDLISNYIEPSGALHLMHLFITGPQAVMKYPMGTGLGTVVPYNSVNPIIHIESEMYLYIVQLGLVGFIVKVFFYIKIYQILLKNKTREAKYALFVLTLFLTGCMVLALNNTRFISNYVWIILGVFFSSYKKEIQENTNSVKRKKILWKAN